MRTIILISSLFLIISCSVLKETNQDSNNTVLLKTYCEELKGELTIIMYDAHDLKCNERNPIGVRVNGKIQTNLFTTCKGCVITISEYEGFNNITPVCNGRTKIHELTVKHRLENGEIKDLVTLNLDELL